MKDKRQKGQSQLDYLWTNYGIYAVSDTVEDNTDEYIPSQKLLLTLLGEVEDKSVGSMSLDGETLVLTSTSGKEIQRVDASEMIPPSVTITDFGQKVVTQEDVSKGCPFPLHTTVYYITLNTGKSFYVKTPKEQLDKLQQELDLLSSIRLSISDDKKYIQLKDANGTDLGKINTADFVKDGMLDTATFDETTHILTLTFNTAAGKEEIPVDLTSLVDTYDGSTIRLKNVAIPTEDAQEPAANDTIDSAIANLIKRDRELAEQPIDTSRLSGTLDASQLTGYISSDIIENGAITGDKIAYEGISGYNIGMYQIGREHLTEGDTGLGEAFLITGYYNGYQETSRQYLYLNGYRIMPHSITAEKIAYKTITGDLIADGVITGYMITPQTITGANIASNTISGANIRSKTITGDHIANCSIKNDHISTGAIRGRSIAMKTITGDNIADHAIPGSKIALKTIRGDNIADYTIPGSKISSFTISGANIADQTISGGNIRYNTITGGNIDINAISGANIASQTISGGNIDIKAIYSSNIADYTITNNQIASQTIVGRNIASGAINPEHFGTRFIINGTYLTGNLPENIVTGGAIASGEIDNTKMMSGYYPNIQISGGNISGAIPADNIREAVVQILGENNLLPAQPEA